MTPHSPVEQVPGVAASARRRIRVAHCLEAVWSGGVEQTRVSLARGLDPDRYEQMLLCTSASGVLPAQLEAAGCRVEEIGPFRFPLDPRPIAAAARILGSTGPTSSMARCPAPDQFR